MSFRDTLLGLLVVFIWGTNFYFMKMALVQLSPLTMGFMRFFFLLFPTLFFLRRPPTSWRLLFYYSITIGFGQFALMFLAMKMGLASGLSSLLMQSQVFFTLVLVALVWGERLNRRQWLALMVGLGGLLTIGLGQFVGPQPLGALLVILGSALAWALGNLLVKHIGPVNGLALAVWGNVFTLLLFALTVPFSPGLDNFLREIRGISAFTLLAVFFQSYASSLLGYGSWGYLLAKYPAKLVAPLALLVPVVGLAIGSLFLHEPLNGYHWLGIGLMILGLALHVFSVDRSGGGKG